MKKDELIAAIVLFIFGLVTVILSLKMPIGNFRTAGSGLFPLCLGILLMLLVLIHAVKSLLAKKSLKEIKVTIYEATTEVKNVVFFLIIVVLSILLFSTIGYFLFAFLLMLFLVRILGDKRWVFNIILSLITAAASYVLFIHWLKIPLPKGILGM
ncbi:MAG: tripartite tricarboxylate transporter TctB family protein [Syntrophorhabdaceae bacterium]|nr:tripartite tricarboxylate transporter TctB family protein [Syntrophorhabdaceae bacterium]